MVLVFSLLGAQYYGVISKDLPDETEALCIGVLRLSRKKNQMASSTKS